MSNAIVFMSDEHNPRYSSPYGHDFLETPNMQRLADEGTLFKNAYCPSPLCVPSRSAFLSGKRVHGIRAYGNTRHYIPPETNGIGARMDEQGIHTVLVGKVHAYRPAEELGFSETLVPHDGAYFFDMAQQRQPLAVRKGAGKRFDKYGPREAPWGKDADRMEAAIDWLKNRAPTIDQPWVMYLNLTRPHFPHFCDDVLWDKYKDHGDLPEHGIEAETAQHPFMVDVRQHFELENVPEEHVRGLRRGYYACVSYIDEQLGRILSALESLDLIDTTNLLYTSDHGEMLGKFGLWWKCNLLEDAARIPCIAMGPDFSPNKQIETSVDLHDVQASVFSVTGATHPETWLGTPLETLTTEDAKKVIFSEYHGHGTRAGSFMVRKANWKLIHNIGAPHQLFDLGSDPEELNNLFDTTQEKARELSKDLLEICDPEVENQKAEEFWQMQVSRFERGDESQIRGLR